MRSPPLSFRSGPIVTLVLGLLGAAAPRLHAQVVLNEILANNTRGLKDSDGAYPDWIELRNMGGQAVNLHDWSLSDDPAQPQKWRFPSVNIAAGGYLVVFASGKDRTDPNAPLHANFELDNQGEYLGLFKPEEDVAVSEFAPRYPPQRADISYGMRDGRLWYFNPPSPNAANTGGFGDFVADTKFSVDRGFIDGPFDLAITCATAGAVIRYTTNGEPPTASGGLVYTAPIPIRRTTVIRAAAFKDGFEPSNVDTQTYIMLADVIRQSPDGKPMPGWPARLGSRTNLIDYGMDPDVVDSPQYRDTIINDLKTIPSFCIGMNVKDLFDATTGIYANPGQDGRAWERQCSLELIDPRGGPGFQINAGIRIRGGFSRSDTNPKHAFRFFFREEYGASKLRFPVFGPDASDSLDAMDLRTFQNYSWSFGGDPSGIFMRDQFSRDTQLAMGSQAERGDYYHLYINGVYWGLYNTCERPEASYAETYFGGNKEDYDVIKVEAGPYTLNATDGNMEAWTRLYEAARAGLSNNTAYFRIQGRNPDGTPNPAYENLVDVDNLIDYMLVIFYGGNLDAPISAFLGNNSPNNWYGIRNRTGRFGGFRFFAHDAEHTLLAVDANRLGPFHAGDSNVLTSSPQWIMQQMWPNQEFRIRIADHIHRHFFNGGVLTPDASRARLLRRKAEIDRAVVGESARWGDAKREKPITRDDWQNAVNNVLNNYIPRRTSNVLEQLRGKGLYPALAAPSFNQHGGLVDAGFQVALSAPAGEILYTVGASLDPRDVGGAPSPFARRYREPISLDRTVTIRARVHQGDSWSALLEATFEVRRDLKDLRLTEIMYNPRSDGSRDHDDFEFLEFKNVGGRTLDLGGLDFTNGIAFTFPPGSRLAPGEFAVLVSDAGAFTNRYPGVAFTGQYGGRLSNGGERITLVQPGGVPVVDVTYGDQAPWPEAADGLGFSLVALLPAIQGNSSKAGQWRASSNMDGSPGADDPVPGIPAVVINEVLPNPADAGGSRIELFNAGTGTADVSGWYLTNDRQRPTRYRIPNRPPLPPGGYLVLAEAEFNAPALGTNAFRLFPAGGELLLLSAGASGTLTGYSDSAVFGGAEPGISLGRNTNWNGRILFVPGDHPTLGAANARPRLDSVVINEVHHHPAPGGVEFVELRNRSANPIPLFDPAFPSNRWKIEGLTFQFPSNTVVPAGGFVLIVNGDPGSVRERFGIPSAIAVFGPWATSLQDDPVRIELQRPGTPYSATVNGVARTFVPYMTVDAAAYGDLPPWPAAAAGGGSSLERRDPIQWGDDLGAWSASRGIPSPDGPNNGNRPPTADAGPDQELTAVQFPAAVQLRGVATDDGLPNPPGRLAYQWKQTGGPVGAVVETPDSIQSRVLLPGTGTFTFQFTANDGVRSAASTVTVTVRRLVAETTLLPFQSVWKYFDQRTDLGTNWRTASFNDSGWKSGKARLGYSDNAVTVIEGGPATNRIPTAYFRRSLSVSNVASIKSLTAHLVRDDGAIVYLNGREIFRSNLPVGDIRFDQFASETVGGDNEFAVFDRAVDSSLLVNGENTLAVEVHQVGITSSDLGFDLSLTGILVPQNTAPVVDAGPDLEVTFPSSAVLRGQFRDDGLPDPPGAPSFGWVRLDGPGIVAFSPTNAPWTTATFSQPGTYTLRLRVRDGELTGLDDVVVRVLSPDGPPAPPLGIALDHGVLQLWLDAVADQAYEVQFTDRLGDRAWRLLTVVAAGPARTITLHGEVPAESARYYRVIRR